MAKTPPRRPVPAKRVGVSKAREARWKSGRSVSERRAVAGTQEPQRPRRTSSATSSFPLFRRRLRLRRSPGEASSRGPARRLLSRAPCAYPEPEVPGALPSPPPAPLRRERGPEAGKESPGGVDRKKKLGASRVTFLPLSPNFLTPTYVCCLLNGRIGQATVPHVSRQRIYPLTAVTGRGLAK